MGSKLLLLNNDHLLYLTGVRDATDFSLVTTATVSASVKDEPDGSTISGGGPVTLNLIDIGSDTVGGEPGGKTIVTEVDGFDIIVTVGTTNSLALSAGRLLRVLHDSQVWQLRLDASGNAGDSVTLHVEPLIWDGNSEPRKVKATIGEVLEIEQASYVGTLDAAFVATEGETYFVDFTASEGGRDGHWTEEVEAEYRTG